MGFLKDLNISKLSRNIEPIILFLRIIRCDSFKHIGGGGGKETEAPMIKNVGALLGPSDVWEEC